MDFGDAGYRSSRSAPRRQSRSDRPSQVRIARSTNGLRGAIGLASLGRQVDDTRTAAAKMRLMAHSPVTAFWSALRGCGWFGGGSSGGDGVAPSARGGPWLHSVRMPVLPQQNPREEPADECVENMVQHSRHGERRSQTHGQMGLWIVGLDDDVQQHVDQIVRVADLTSREADPFAGPGSCKSATARQARHSLTPHSSLKLPTSMNLETHRGGRNRCIARDGNQTWQTSSTLIVHEGEFPVNGLTDPQAWTSPRFRVRASGERS